MVKFKIIKTKKELKKNKIKDKKKTNNLKKRSYTIKNQCCYNMLEQFQQRGAIQWGMNY